MHNLIKVINQHTKHMNSGEILLCSDSKMILNGCSAIVNKESQCVQEASVTIAGIKNKLTKSKITITLEHSNDKPRLHRIFQQEPGPVLVKECDRNLRQLRLTLVEDDIKDIPHIAPTTPIHQGEIKDKEVAVLTREIDVRKFENDYAKSKLLEK